jgi:aminoglycoside phosphotransferase (APT) family kinase protein
MVTAAARDLVQVRERLEGWLVERFPAGAAPVVSDLVVPDSNGVSTETILFDVRWTSDGEVRSASMVARVAPDEANRPIFPTYDIPGQFRTVSIIDELGVVPVPKPHWCEPDAAVLGSPFFVMDRVDGIVPPDVMPYSYGSWVTEGTPEQRSTMQERSVEILARIHGIDRPAERFDHVGGGSMRAVLDAERRYYDWIAADGGRVPLFERMFAWLDDHLPADEGAPVLCWGDARIGNIIYRDFVPVAVLDWEMAMLAPPETDLAWFTFLHRLFEFFAAQFDLDSLPDFLRQDDVLTAYERMSGHTPRHTEFYDAFAALRASLPIFRANQRGVLAEQGELPDDPHELIRGRELLEDLIAS